VVLEQLWVTAGQQAPALFENRLDFGFHYSTVSGIIMTHFKKSLFAGKQTGFL
jgi:hypothetical protein